MIYLVSGKEMMLRLLVLAATLTVAIAAPAWGAEPPIGECDRLAAHPDDDQRVHAGTPFAAVDGERAARACEAALAAAPEAARLRFQYARALDKVGFFQEALRQYRNAASKDYAAAQYSLAMIFARSPVMLWNEMRAARWFRKAADSGHAAAQYRLGLLHVVGRGVPQDDGEAARLVRAAAQQGLARAQAFLGRMYDEGLGVAEDDVEAALWYGKAAEQGLGRARFALAALDPDADEALRGQARDAGRDPDAGTGEAAATPETTQAADETVPTAPGSAAVPDATGIGDVTAVGNALGAGLTAYNAGDYRAAYEVWFPLARRGVRRAEFYVGGLLMDGLGVEADKVQAYFWLKRAADGGYPGAHPLLIELTSRMSAEEMRHAEELIAAGLPGS